MTDYRTIYNHIVQTDARYNLAENSPGLRAVVEATNALRMISGRALDIGCGVGFVVEYLSSETFDLVAHGADISDQSIQRAVQRLAHLAGVSRRLTVLAAQRLPFDDEYFSLVTCFDMLEHLDLPDIAETLSEAHRVLRPGGTFFGSVSCRPAGIIDQFGDNLHRTIQSVDWWLDRLQPEKAEYDGVRKQLKFWKRNPLVRRR
jgi:ubiquinone/menaquinone biosynthesis C-methylase UbiE